MRTYSKDREFSDRYLDPLRRILGPFVIGPAPVALDIHEATDLVMMSAANLRIAARVRSHKYAERYPNEFTIRFQRHDSGMETEMSKILKGFGDWMIYAYACPNDSLEIADWMIIDLNSFRYHLEFNESQILWEHKYNSNYATSFLAFDVTSFPKDPPILIGRSQKVMADA